MAAPNESPTTSTGPLDAEGVEKPGHLADEEVQAVRRVEAIGPSAPVVVEPDGPEAGAAEALEERIGEVGRHREGGGEDHHPPGVGARRLVVRQAVREADELPGRGGTRLVVEGAALGVLHPIGHQGGDTGQERDREDQAG